MNRSPPSRRRAKDGTELREMFQRRRRSQRERRRPPTQPGSAFEAVTRQMVESLRHEVGDVKKRINQLIMLLVGAIIAEMFARFMGIGL